MPDRDFSTYKPDIYNRIINNPELLSNMHAFNCSNRYISERLTYSNALSGDIIIFCAECGNPLFSINGSSGEIERLK